MDGKAKPFVFLKICTTTKQVDFILDEFHEICLEAMLPYRFSFFGDGGYSKVGTEDGDISQLNPTLKLQTDRDVYRPGDSIYVTIEISNPLIGDKTSSTVPSLWVERLGFEIKGIEKLDTQWFAIQKPSTGMKHGRGEHVFLDSSTPSMVSNQIVTSGSSKNYVVRAMLPSVIPPSYKGTTIRYLYYIKSTMSVPSLLLENGHSSKESVKDLTKVEARVPFQVWVTEKGNGLVMEDGQSDDIVPSTTIQTDMYWKEIDGDSEWARVSDTNDGVEEGYESSRDEISSVSSYNPLKENLFKSFRSSLSFESTTARSSNRDGPYHDIDYLSLPSNVRLHRLSVAEVMHDSNTDKSLAVLSPSQQQAPARTLYPDVTGVSSAPTESVACKIGGTLTFFHEEGARRCLEVSVTLETSETINRRFVHPSRRNSPTITKVQSDHHEVVADLVQTSFLFSIPMDGPMSFSTPHISVEWALRFEFFTTPKNLDWTRYDHPLLVEGRDKSEWVLPITVHAPPSGTSSTLTRTEKPFSLEPLWVHS
ncbi:Reduced growth phenotype protein 1 [Gossypium australe]|uniref:Reduced growth phenotype protein 1 n=1 Tax=Gossypium australe TaxID=47621 RepID=A0A5B6V069_9ROSI|nr:Reduced growth phenotype protein 1 [Gossypium australe]